MKKSLKILLALAALAISQNLQAQVGINIANPDSNAALHIKGSMKGVLFPNVNSGERATMANGNKVTNGMTVFDMDEKLYYFRDKENDKWLVLNPWRLSDVTVSSWSDIRLGEKYKDRNVYIGSDLSQKAEARLHIGGKLKTNEQIKTETGIIGFTDNIVLCSSLDGVYSAGPDPRTAPGIYKLILGRANAFESILDNVDIIGSSSAGRYYNLRDRNSVDFFVNGNIFGKEIVVDKVDANYEIKSRKGFEGYGTIPLGGIIMWSGKDIPDGWALCSGQTLNGYKTPDLSGRFIVGYTPDNSDYDDPGNFSQKGTSAGKMGGQKEVTLTGEQMPRHTHFSQRVNGDDGANANFYLSSSRSLSSPDGITEPSDTGGRTGYSGNDKPHENRPPYYVLAFIMRVK